MKELYMLLIVVYELNKELDRKEMGGLNQSNCYMSTKIKFNLI